MTDFVVLCVRRCGKAVLVPGPEPPRPPRSNSVARWWRRRTVSVRRHFDAYRLGCAVRDAQIVHAILDCEAFAAEELTWHDDNA